MGDVLNSYFIFWLMMIRVVVVSKKRRGVMGFLIRMLMVKLNYKISCGNEGKVNKFLLGCLLDGICVFI